MRAPHLLSVAQFPMYSYLLGMYLGDGYICRTRRTYRLHSAAGRKHRRPIILEPWQRRIVEQHPLDFLGGCIESDGCRHRRIVAGRNYPAYSCTNHSTDILELFVWVCGLVGLRPRRPNRVTVSLARRADVSMLDNLLDTDGSSVERGPHRHVPDPVISCVACFPSS